jgi:hypothetical protein
MAVKRNEKNSSFPFSRHSGKKSCPVKRHHPTAGFNDEKAEGIAVGTCYCRHHGEPSETL